MTEPPETDSAAGLDPKERDRIERLRDRTDEIELIISGLTTVALFTLPGWLFATLSERFSHRSVMASQVTEMALLILPGLFYALGGCFALHLMIRAYWAGLIGLRSAFPAGIDWDRVPGMGRLTRQHYRARLTDLDHAISTADHLASSLFAVISMIALSMLWALAYLVLVIAVGVIIGASIGDPDRALTMALWLIMPILLGLPTLLWLLDSAIGKRFPGVLERPAYRRLVQALIRANGWIWPQRLILPVQLTLQTNTRPYLFSLLFAIGTIGIVLLGAVRYQAWTQFTLSEEFRFLDAADLNEGIDSAHYEDLRAERDRLRPVPTISTFEQGSAFVRVFLPYYPQRDNPVLEARCKGTEGVEQAPLDCLRQLWRLQLGTQVLEPAALLPTERRDLNQRGLTGVLSLAGLRPGVHVLEATRNPAPVPEDTETEVFRVPFLYAPAQELPARSPAGSGTFEAPFH